MSCLKRKENDEVSEATAAMEEELSTRKRKGKVLQAAQIIKA